MEEHPQQLALVDGNHDRRGYDESIFKHYAAYHFFIGTDSTLVQTRPLTDRTLHTKNCAVALTSIGIVVAGSFDTDEPTAKQRATLLALVRKLKARYHIANQNIIGHQEASATSCPGKNLMALIKRWRGEK